MAGFPFTSHYLYSDYQMVAGASVELEDVHRAEDPTTQRVSHSSNLPSLDSSLGTRTSCLVALALSYAVALASIATSFYLYALDADAEWFYDHTWSMVTSVSPATRTVLDLVLSAVNTVCTESMGYTHTVALRWALLRENRLHYSSNLRLLHSAHHSWPNCMWINFLSSIALVISYAGASQTLVPYSNGGQYPAPPSHGALANGPALLFLGSGLLVQALIVTACLVKDFNRMPTWSSNVLTITLACIHRSSGNIKRSEGRCLLSAYDTVQAAPPVPVRPRDRQPSLRTTDPNSGYITLLVWALTAVAFLWAIVVMVLTAVLPEQPANVEGYFPTLDLPGDTISTLFLALIVVAAFQSFATLALHSVELLVNRSRDEQCWRQSSSTHIGPNKLDGGRAGSRKSYNSILAVVTSWQSVGLLILKPLIHWLFGSSLSTSNTFGSSAAHMDRNFLFALAAATLVLAVFASLLSRHQPKRCYAVFMGSHTDAREFD